MSFQVVGVFDHDGPYASEIWGDAQVMSQVLERPGFNRILAVLKPGTDLAALTKRLDEDKQVPAKLLSEASYLASQTAALSASCAGSGSFLAAIMGTAAIFTGTNTMLAALASRTHEVGILLALGFRPLAIFLRFLLESLILGLLGGAVGCLMALPINGVQHRDDQLPDLHRGGLRLPDHPPGPDRGRGLLAGPRRGRGHGARLRRPLRPTQALRRE